MEPDDGHDDDPTEYRRPPSPDDRLWRHPSEVTAPPDAVSRVRGPWLVAALSAVVGGVLVTGVVAATGVLGDHRSHRSEVTASTGALMAPTVLAAARRARDSTVALEITTEDGTTKGLGVVFQDGGYVMTNAHLLENALSVRAHVGNGAARGARVVGVDKEFDVAVVKVDHINAPSARIGSAGDLRPGQMLVAVARADGNGHNHAWATLCTVTGLHRSVRMTESRVLLDMIETDSPGATGSNGAALLDSTGAIVGINNAAASRAIGGKTGLATPIDVARMTAEQLANGGQVHKPWLGIEGADVDAQIAKELNIKGGALVGKVLPESPAAIAGFRERDVVVMVDGQPIETMSMLVVLLHLHHPGETVTFELLRGTTRQTVKVALGEKRS